MSHFEKSEKKEPQLPEGVSADHILNNYPGKQIAALAQESGMALEAYERFLARKAREERVAKTVAGVQQALAAEAPNEQSAYEKVAEDAVMKGVKQMRAYIEKPSISERREEEYYSNAYECLNRIEMEPSGTLSERDISNLRSSAVNYFGYAIQARAIRELFENVHKGMSFPDAKALVVASFHEQSKKQNIPELGEAYRREAQHLNRTIQMQQTWAAIDPLVEHYNAGAMSEFDKELLQRLVACAKAAYFKGKFEKEMLERFDLVGFDQYIQMVVDAYRKYGPHKTSSGRVSGPSEVFGLTQTGSRNMGYSSGSKRRPKRGTRDDERF